MLQQVESSRMRIVPEFPALAGGFFATEPPGKPPCIFFEKIFFPRAPAVVREWSGGLPGVARGVDVWGRAASLGCLLPLAPATPGHHQFGRNVALEMEPTSGLWEGSRWNYKRKCCLMIMRHLFSFTIFGFTFYLFIFLNYLFICFWLCWIFDGARASL